MMWRLSPRCDLYMDCDRYLCPKRAGHGCRLYRERRGAALGTYTACTQAGALLGPVLGGWLVYAAGFSATFVTAGVFGCMGALVFLLLRLAPPVHRA